MNGGSNQRRVRPVHGRPGVRSNTDAPRNPAPQAWSANADNFRLSGVMKFPALPQDDLHDRGVSMSKVGARSED